MSAKSKFPRASGMTSPNENPPKTHLQLPETPQTTNTLPETLSIDESATTSTSSQTKLNQPQETGLFVTLKRRMKRLFGFTNDTSTLHKSLQNLTLTRDEYDKRKSCSTENNIKAFAMRHVKRDYITNDVPEDVSSLKKEYEFAMIQLTSMTDPQILEVRKSWDFLKVHIEKIGVIMFLG
ncbi:hypothetical protein P879_07379 [Paragonimus westermani]|uniref:Uncharacterized protein n=1 Tax=Paragonimus westermani TaxID=34504 RepID=A0A8T0D380_9TREM|nr:hypothetical protein P879_07379 [Paragonimus westermani]